MGTSLIPRPSFLFKRKESLGTRLNGQLFTTFVYLCNGCQSKARESLEERPVRKWVWQFHKGTIHASKLLLVGYTRYFSLWMMEQDNCFWVYLSLSPVIPLMILVTGLISENVDKYAMSAKGCPRVHSSQSNTATTRGWIRKSWWQWRERGGEYC